MLVFAWQWQRLKKLKDNINELHSRVDDFEHNQNTISEKVGAGSVERELIFQDVARNREIIDRVGIKEANELFILENEINE